MCVSRHHCTSKIDVAKINYFYYTRTNSVILGLPLGSYLRHILTYHCDGCTRLATFSMDFFIAQVFDREPLAVLYLRTISSLLQLLSCFKLYILLRMATHIASILILLDRYGYTYDTAEISEGCNFHHMVVQLLRTMVIFCKTCNSMHDFG